MKQSRLDRAVARATGEPIAVIRRMGFSVIGVPVRPCRPKGVTARNGKNSTTNADA